MKDVEGEVGVILALQGHQLLEFLFGKCIEQPETL